MTSGRVQVAVGIIFNSIRDKVLMAKRPDYVHQGGLWEFPGGKILESESTQNALKRELSEELDITIFNSKPLIQLNHDYPDKKVTLKVLEVKEWKGVPKGNEGQDIKWVAINNISKIQVPKANNSIVAAISLPSVYWITPDLDNYGDKFLAKARNYLEAGLRLIQFRSTREIDSETQDYIQQLLGICSGFNCRVLMNSTPEEAVTLGAHGIHLSSKNLLLLNERPLGNEYLVAASCHDQQELEHACSINVDFVVLSPVNKTSSHPRAQALGWDNFGKLTRLANIPVYALGGMSIADINDAKGNGAQGVAMISGLWNNPNAGFILRSRINDRANQGE